MLAVLNLIACLIAAPLLALYSHRLDPHISGWANASWRIRLALEAVSAALALSGLLQALRLHRASLCEVFVNLTVAMLAVAAYAVTKPTGARLDQQRERRSA